MLADPREGSSDHVVKRSLLVDTTQRRLDRLRVTRRHLFVCTNARSSGKPACGPRGGAALLAAVQHELLARGATNILATACGCLGPCFDGPNAVVYPEGVWYAGLDASDTAGIVDHLIGGTVHAAKATEAPGEDERSAPGDDEG